MEKLRSLFFASLTGLVSGFSLSFFLVSLSFVTQLRSQYPQLIFAFPIVGLILGIIYHHYGYEIAPETGLILDEIHEPKKILPFKFAPIVYFSTLLSHLAGASVGREGAAVQISASLSDRISKVFKIHAQARKRVLLAGMSAGFGGAVGAPFAGIFFGMEVFYGRLKWRALPECALASFISYQIATLLHAPHLNYNKLENLDTSLKTIPFVIFVAIFFGLLARGFMKLTHQFEIILKNIFPNAYVKAFFGGFVLLGLFYFLPLEAFSGLGLQSIENSFRGDIAPASFMIKALLTALCLAFGFKGGEFVPLIFIGATSASVIAALTGVSTPFLVALGFSAVFAAASRTPFTSSVMAIEFFGWKIGPWVILVNFIAVNFAGPRKIYQRANRAMDSLETKSHSAQAH